MGIFYFFLNSDEGCKILFRINYHQKCSTLLGLVSFFFFSPLCVVLVLEEHLHIFLPRNKSEENELFPCIHTCQYPQQPCLDGSLQLSRLSVTNAYLRRRRKEKILYIHLVLRKKKLSRIYQKKKKPFSNLHWLGREQDGFGDAFNLAMKMEVQVTRGWDLRKKMDEKQKFI